MAHAGAGVGGPSAAGFGAERKSQSVAGDLAGCRNGTNSKYPDRLSGSSASERNAGVSRLTPTSGSASCSTRTYTYGSVSPACRPYASARRTPLRPLIAVSSSSRIEPRITRFLCVLRQTLFSGTSRSEPKNRKSPANQRVRADAHGGWIRVDKRRSPWLKDLARAPGPFQMRSQTAGLGLRGCSWPAVNTAAGQQRVGAPPSPQEGQPARPCRIVGEPEAGRALPLLAAAVLLSRRPDRTDTKDSSARMVGLRHPDR